MREEKEYHEQCALVEYLEILKNQGKVVLFTAIKHNLWTKSIQQKMKQHREGLRPGFPDLAIILRAGGKNKMIFIEMKAQKRDGGGRVSEFQEAWIKEINACGIPIYVCHGYEEAKKIIDHELKENNFRI